MRYVIESIIYIASSPCRHAGDWRAKLDISASPKRDQLKEKRILYRLVTKSFYVFDSNFEDNFKPTESVRVSIKHGTNKKQNAKKMHTIIFLYWLKN